MVCADLWRRIRCDTATLLALYKKQSLTTVPFSSFATTAIPLQLGSRVQLITLFRSIPRLLRGYTNSRPFNVESNPPKVEYFSPRPPFPGGGKILAVPVRRVPIGVQLGE